MHDSYIWSIGHVPILLTNIPLIMILDIWHIISLLYDNEWSICGYTRFIINLFIWFTTILHVCIIYIDCNLFNFKWISFLCIQDVYHRILSFLFISHAYWDLLSSHKPILFVIDLFMITHTNILVQIILCLLLTMFEMEYTLTHDKLLVLDHL